MTIRNLEGTKMAKHAMVRFEKLAQGIADGQLTRRAATAAGYSAHSSFCHRLTKRREFKERADALRRRGGESADLGPVIDRLMEAADTALADESQNAAKLNVAARLLIAAARLKRQAPRSPEPDEDEAEVAEWLAKYGPKS
jgi:hypothetical protein